MVLGSLVVALALHASPRAVTLEHHAPETCPDQPWVEGNVTARLGFSPFTTNDPRALSVRTTVHCADGTCEGTLTVHDGAQLPRARTLRAESCVELMESIALSLALIIDPQLLARPPPPPQPAPAPAPAPAPPPEPKVIVIQTPAPPPPPREPVHFQGVLTGHGAMGLSPYLTGGGALAVGLRVAWFGLLAEAQFNAPVAVEVEAGRVISSTILGSLLACGHVKGLGLCLVGTGGALQVTGDVPSGLRRSSPLGLIGGRLAYELMLVSWLGLHAHLDVVGVLTRTTVRDANGPVWVTSVVAGNAALGLVVVF